MKSYLYPLVLFGAMPVATQAAPYQPGGGQNSSSYNQPMDQSMSGSGQTADDRRILLEIKSQFEEYDLPGADAIKVTVKNGMVTIEGVVDSDQNRRDAEEIATDVDGVNNVSNRLKIREASSGPQNSNLKSFELKQNTQMKQNFNYRPSAQGGAIADESDDEEETTPKTANQWMQKGGADKELEQKVKGKLNSGMLADRFSNVQTQVAKGTVTLTGTVKSAIDKLEAEKKAKEVSGVKAVVNKIQVGAL